MSNKKFVNKGLQIGTQINQTGANVNNAVRDINVYQNKAGFSVQEFQALLGEIVSEINSLNLSSSKKSEIGTYIKTAGDQTKEKKPEKNLIIGPLSIALDLLIKAGGAAKAAESIVPLFEKAIAFAQRLF